MGRKVAGDQAGAQGAADEAVHGGAGGVGGGLGLLALAAEDDEFGAGLDVGKDLGGMAELEGGGDG